MKTIAVIGGGCIGMAITRELSKHKCNVYLIEKNLKLGLEATSRNSQVIHAGIYYKPTSLKSKLCKRGKKLLYKFCQEYDVPHKKLGKCIISSSDYQTNQLNDLIKLAKRNGVDDLEYYLSNELRLIEPEIQAKAAIFSPSTGIIDTQVYLQTLEFEIEKYGGIISFHTEVLSAMEINNKNNILLTCRDTNNKEIYQISFDFVINCSGIEAPFLASKFKHPNFKWLKLPNQFAKGSYFRLKNPILKPFKHLIYPLPEKDNSGLGIHVTLDLDNNVKFGPDVKWIKNRYDYSIQSSDAFFFDKMIRNYWPNLPYNSLIEDFSGIRPKYEDDFYIIDGKIHEIPRVLHLLGFESPGLTSSLAVGKEIVEHPAIQVFIPEE